MFCFSASSPSRGGRQRAGAKCITGEQCEQTILITGLFLKLPFSFAGSPARKCGGDSQALFLLLLLKAKCFLSRMQQPAAGDRSTAVPSPYPSQAGFAADSYYTHRVIEDPEWSLATVPHLAELCLQHIVHNFESKRERVSPGTHGERVSVPGSRGSTRQADASKRQCGTQPCQRNRWGETSPQAAS